MSDMGSPRDRKGVPSPAVLPPPAPTGPRHGVANASKKTSVGAPLFAPPAPQVAPEPALPRVESEHALRDHWLGEVMAARSPDAEGWSLTVALDPLIALDARTAAAALEAAPVLDVEGLLPAPQLVQLADRRLGFCHQWVDGVSLAEAIRGVPMETSRALSVLRQIASIVGGIHAAGVSHGSLSPYSILLTAGDGNLDTVSVMDLGLRAAVPEIVASPAAEADVVPLSPERSWGQETGTAEDVYGIGCIAFLLLTGEPPFPGGEVQEVRHRHASEAAPPLGEFVDEAQVSKKIALVVDKCLSKDPDDRWEDARAFNVALARAIKGKNPLAGATTSSQEVVPTPTPTPQPAPVPVPVGAPDDLGFMPAPMEAPEAMQTGPVAVLPAELPSRRWQPVAAVAVGLLLLGLGGWAAFGGSDGDSATEVAAKGDAGDGLRNMEAPAEGADQAALEGKAKRVKGAAAADEDDGAGAEEAADAVPAEAGEEVAPAGDDPAAEEPGGLLTDEEFEEAADVGTGEEPADDAPDEVIEEEPEEPVRDEGDDGLREDDELDEAADEDQDLAVFPSDGKPVRNKDRAQAIAERGKEAHHAGRTRQARKLYREALELNSKNLTALSGLTELYFNRGSYGAAIKYGKKAVRVNPRSRRLRLALGDAYYKHGNKSSARKHYEKAKALGSKTAVRRLAKLGK